MCFFFALLGDSSWETISSSDPSVSLPSDSPLPEPLLLSLPEPLLEPLLLSLPEPLLLSLPEPLSLPICSPFFFFGEVKEGSCKSSSDNPSSRFWAIRSLGV